MTVSGLAEQPPEQSVLSVSPVRLTSEQPYFGRHVTSAAAQPATLAAEGLAQAIENDEPELSPLAMTPTRSSFLATWKEVPGASNYRLEVSTDRNFRSDLVNLDTGKATFRIVSELQPHTTYYYRVRSFDSAGQSSYSEIMSAATNSNTGFVIAPTYDSSVISSEKSGAIQAMISNVIVLYQSLFTDPITVHILFRYAATAPDGGPLLSGAISQSDTLYYPTPWPTYLSALKADASTQNDFTANASLPASILSTNINAASAASRAIGLTAPPRPYPGGQVGGGLGYDGIVTFNSTSPLRFVRPSTNSTYDARTAAEHEIDEVLGLGSHLRQNSTSESDLHPQDLFSWMAPLARNTTSIGPRYFSLDRGVTRIVDFNQNPAGDLGDWLSPPCPQLYPLVQNAFGCPGSSPDVSLSSPEVTNLDVIGYDLTPGELGPATLANISTRLRVGSGDGVLIGGFIITGSGPKKILLRAIGPSLSLPGTLADPTLELHSSDALIASNNDWQTSQAAEIMATGIPPKDSKEAAIVATLDPGSYTAIVKGSAGGPGIALVEAYDLDPAGDPKLANISTRGVVGIGDNVLIGGFIIQGGESGQILLRALGPSLTLSGSLADPTLELYDGNGMLLAANDDWRTDQQTTIAATGIPPSQDAESAIVSTLPPGSYSVIVRGKDNGTGVSLVEVYRLND